MENRNALLNVSRSDNSVAIALQLSELGFKLFGTLETYTFLKNEGVPITHCYDLIDEDPDLSPALQVALTALLAPGLSIDISSQTAKEELETLKIPVFHLAWIELGCHSETDAEQKTASDLLGIILLNAAIAGRRIIVPEDIHRHAEVLSWIRTDCPEEDKYLMGQSLLAHKELAQFHLDTINRIL